MWFIRERAILTDSLNRNTKRLLIQLHIKIENILWYDIHIQRMFFSEEWEKHGRISTY